MNKFYLGVFLILLSTAGFGAMPIFAQYAYSGGISVLTLLFIRFTLAAMFFFTYIFVKTRKIGVTRKNLLSLFILGGVCYTMQSLFYFLSVKYIPVSLAVLILYTYPIFVSVLSHFIDKERIDVKVALSIGVCFAGLVLIMGNAFQGINYIGIILAFGASLVYSCYIVFGNRVVKNVPPIITSSFVTLFAAIGLLTIGASTNSINFDFDKSVWLTIIGLVLFSTILAILTFFQGLELLGSTKSSILSMTEPLFTILFSFVLLKERLGWSQAIGGAAVLAGAVMVVWFQESRKRVAEEVKSDSGY